MKSFKKRKFNRLQKKILNKERMRRNLTGKGLFIYRNNTNGDLTLPKPDVDGNKTVAPRATWKGDDYFMFMVKTHEATLVETLQGVEMDKLILDQPDQVTEKGQVEHVVVRETKPINEVFPEDEVEQKRVLINERPIDGVEIILND